MTSNTPKDHHQRPHAYLPLPLLQQQQQQQAQQPLPQDFKQKLETLYNQCQSWFDHHKQDLDTLEKHQHDINQAHLESVANVKAKLQMAQSDIAFLRSNIRIQEDRIEEVCGV
jgi:1,6-anhydro-N-acetylmuramate kinase